MYISKDQFQDKKVKKLFAIIEKLRKDWAYADSPTEPPPLNADGEVNHDSDCYEDENDESRVDPPKSSKLERKGAKDSLARATSSSSVDTLSPPNALLKGMGIDVVMTMEQEKELHEVIKKINELTLGSQPNQVFQKYHIYRGIRGSLKK